MTSFRPFGRKWMTCEDQIFTLSDGQQVLVPRDYLFDGHSVPWPVYWLLPRYTEDVYAALLHDFLYDLKERGFDGFTRLMADREYRHCMKELGAPWYRHTVHYYAVRFFGWIWWCT